MKPMLELTAANYRQVVENSSGPVLLDVWAPWCAPCRAMEPVLRELEADLGDRVTFAKLNADEYPDLISAIGVTGLPTLRMRVAGRAVYESVGAAAPSRLRGAV